MWVRRLLLVTTVAAALLAAGCAAKVPSAAPGIVGAITSVESSDSGVTVLVEGGQQPAGAVSDKASVRVTDDTTVIDTDGSSTDPARLATGMRVRVWFEGPVAESYPVQGTAAVVEIRSAQAP